MDVKRVGNTEVNQNTAVGNAKNAKNIDPKKGVPTDSPNRSVGSASEKVEWSDDAQLTREAISLAKQEPALRHEKIASLKEAIKNGTYQVDSKKVADSMIQQSLEEALLK